MGDLDNDGRQDLVGRNRGHSSLTRPSSGEGLVVTHLDRDGKPDIVVNRCWLKNTSRPGSLRFVRHLYNAAAAPKAYIAINDLAATAAPTR